MLPGFTSIAQSIDNQFQLLAQQQAQQQRLLTHLEMQQAQEALRSARQSQENRELVDKAISRNQDSVDALSRTIRAMMEHDRNPHAGFQKALEDFAVQLAASQTARDIALQTAVAKTTEASAHRVLEFLDAYNRQQSTFEGLAQQNAVVQRLVEEVRVRQDQRSISPEAVAQEVGGGPPPGPPPAPMPRGRMQRSRSREPKPFTRLDMEKALRLSAAALRAESFRGTLPARSVAATVRYPSEPPQSVASSVSRETSRAPSEPAPPKPSAVRKKPVEVISIATPTRGRSAASKDESRASSSASLQPPPRKVAAVGPERVKAGRRGGGIVVLPIAA